MNLCGAQPMTTIRTEASYSEGWGEFHSTQRHFHAVHTQRQMTWHTKDSGVHIGHTQVYTYTYVHTYTMHTISAQYN